MLILIKKNPFIKRNAMLKKRRQGDNHPHQSSVILDLKSLFKLKGITQPIAYLIKIGINNTSAQKMYHGKAIQINFRQLTALCVNLNCTPNDLFAIRKMELPPKHELNKIRTYTEVLPMEISEFLKDKSLAEIQEIMEKYATDKLAGTIL